MTGVVILEGPDGAGKTTLANYLAQHHGAVVLHQGYRFRNQIFTYHTAVLMKAAKLAQEGRLVVLDRLWLSEAIYAQVYRNGSQWPHQGRLVDRILLSLGALTVFCLPGRDGEGPEAAVRRHMENPGRPELYPKVEQAVEVARLYKETYWGERDPQLKPWTNPPGWDYRGQEAMAGGMVTRQDAMLYNWHTWEGLLGSWVDSALARLFELQPRSMARGLTGNSANPRALFVGDQLNAKGRLCHLPPWPFYDYGNSSLYLARACHEAHLDEVKCAWVNSWTPGDSLRERRLYSELKRLNPAVIVALGEKAADRLRALGHPATVELPHPQWGNRFDSQGKHYFPLLAEAVKSYGLRLP